MLSDNDYAKMSREELASAAQKMKSQKITTAVFIGVLIGIAVYSATHRGFVLPVILLVFAFLMGKRQSQNHKSLEAEISRRDSIL